MRSAARASWRCSVLEARAEARLLPRLASVSDAPCAGEGGAGLQPDQGLSASKRVGRTGHGLDGKTATVDAWRRVAGEHHQVRVVPIDPERDAGSVVGILELHAGKAVLIP